MKTRKEIFQKVCEKLAPLVSNETLKYVDLNMGQLQTGEKNYPVSFPAVFIQIDSIAYQHQVEDRAEGETSISLIVAYNNSNDSFIGSTSKAKSENLLDLLDTIIETMTYTRGDNFTDLHLESEQFLPYAFKGIHAHQITFTTTTYHKLKTNGTVRITSGT